MISSRSSSDRKRKRLRFMISALLFCFVLGTTNLAYAQSWAENLFTIKSHDFGSIPLNSDTRFAFKFRNTTNREIHVVSATSSCSCTDVIYPKKAIRPGETGEIVAKINTSGQHLRKKGATVTVHFDRPSTAFVQLEVSVYIRPDVVLSPGMVDFGSVREGKAMTRTVQLHYAGDPNWELKRIDRANNNPFISAVAEKFTTPGNAREVSWNIQVTLSDKAPPGYFREILRFVTNEGPVDSNGRTASIELPVSGLIMDALVAKPSPFQFGSVAPGTTVTKYLVLRASQPFRVLNVRCPEDQRFVFSQSDQTSSIHIVAVTLTSRQNEEETIARTVFVKTDLEDQETLKVRVYACFLTNEDVVNYEPYAPTWKDQILGTLNPPPETEEQDMVSNKDSDPQGRTSVPVPKYLNAHTQPQSPEEETYPEDQEFNDIFVENEPIEHPRILRHYVPGNSNDKSQEESLIGNEQCETESGHEKNPGTQNVPYSSSLPLPKKLGANPVKKPTQQLRPDSEPIVSRRTPLKQLPQWRQALPEGQTAQNAQEQEQEEDSIFTTPVSPEQRDSEIQNPQQDPQHDTGETSEQDWVPADRSANPTEEQTENPDVKNDQDQAENANLHAVNSSETPLWQANASLDQQDSGNLASLASKTALIMDFVDEHPAQKVPIDAPAVEISFDLPENAIEVPVDSSSGVLFDVPQVVHTKKPQKTKQQVLQQVLKPAPLKNQVPSKPIVTAPTWTSRPNR